MGNGGFISPYYDIVFLVAVVMAFYIGIKYAAGKFFTNTGWEAAALIEMSELWKSLLAVFLAVGFFEASRTISCMLSGGDPVYIAIAFLQKIMYKGILEAINDVFTIQMVYSIYNTFSFRPHEAVWTWTFKIFPGADAIVNIMNMIGYGLVATLGSVSAQIFILTVINATMYQLFLPAGILLRFFPPTRDAGTFLIAFSIGFQVIFPTTYVLNKMALDNIWVANGRGSEFNPYIGSTAIGAWKYAFLTSAFTVSGAGMAGVSIAEKLIATFKIHNKLGGLLVNFINVSTMEILAYNITIGLLRPILEALAELSLVALVLPALSTTITFSAINAITKFAKSQAG